MSEQYLTVATVPSSIRPGVTFFVKRMSFGRRLELMRVVRELTTRLDFESASDQIDGMKASILAAEVDGLYVRWGLRAVDGLEIDGERANPDMLAAVGPEDLFLEALEAVKRECFLSETEKKN